MDGLIHGYPTLSPERRRKDGARDSVADPRLFTVFETGKHY
jgi:hypothetical protein